MQTTSFTTSSRASILSTSKTLLDKGMQVVLKLSPSKVLELPIKVANRLLKCTSSPKSSSSLPKFHLNRLNFLLDQAALEVLQTSMPTLWVKSRPLEAIILQMQALPLPLQPFLQELVGSQMLELELTPTALELAVNTPPQAKARFPFHPQMAFPDMARTLTTH